MRCPLASMLFFIGKLLIFLRSLKQVDSRKVEEQITYLSMVKSQTELTLSFVNDLLDLR